MTEITRFEMDMDGSMEPSEHGEWVRYEDAQRELDSQYKLGMEAEREACAKVCEKECKFDRTSADIVIAIRNRGNT